MGQASPARGQGLHHFVGRGKTMLGACRDGVAHQGVDLRSRLGADGLGGQRLHLSDLAYPCQFILIGWRKHDCPIVHP
jgi:hypothetical protein